MSEANAAASERVIDRRVLLVILDGFGFNQKTERRILDSVAVRLSNQDREVILSAIRSAAPELDLEPSPLLDAMNRLALSPVLPTAALAPELAVIPYDQLAEVYSRVRAQMAEPRSADLSLLENVHALVEEEALAARYAVWYARSSYLDSLRNTYPTVSTEAAGLAAGYEDVTPPVQGNSETGHQQIGNFIVAAQTPLEISTEIADGSFFRNPALLECLETVKQRGSALDVCFLLSGEYGNDGRVHSAWNHLEALLEAAFVRAGLLPSQLRIQAITDGRDCPPYSSVERVGDQYGFLYKLRELLRRYGAEESLAWVIGRSIAMDRDFEESRTKQDLEMLIEGRGTQVANIDAAIAAVKALHAAGHTDTSIPPILVGDSPRTIQPGDAFLDLNFRADRQRSKIAALLGARDFLQREAAKKGQHWDLAWLKTPPGLSVFCLSEYHPEFAEKYGAKVLYPIRPQAHNLFALLPEQSQAQGFAFRYLLTAESTKALHVGYFIRGRREAPTIADEEERVIVPSYGADYGVLTDDDYYKTPQMRAFTIAETVVDGLSRREFDLIAVNFANTDMIGHLMPKRWDAAQRSVELIYTVLETIVPTATRFGYDVIITADHGNVEDDDASHTANEILTTFVSPDSALELRYDPRERARLFDIPWSITELMGLTERIVPALPPIPKKIEEQGLVGRSLIRVTRAQKDPASEDEIRATAAG